MPFFQKLVTDKKVVLITYALICFLNYMILYKSRLYEEVFNDFEHNLIRYGLKSWDVSVKLYITISICLFLILMIIADLKNHSHL